MHVHKCNCVCVLVCPACVCLYSVYVSRYLVVYVFHTVCLVSAYTRACWHVCMWVCCNFLFACSQSFVINRVIHSSSSMASMSNSAPWRHLKRPSWYLQTVADCCRLLQTIADCCRLLQTAALCCSVLWLHEKTRKGPLSTCCPVRLARTGFAFLYTCIFIADN